MAQAAHSTLAKVSTSDSSYNTVDGVKSVEFNASGEQVDVTDFADTSGAHLRILALQDLSISMSGDYEGSDTNGQVLIRTSLTTGATVWCQVLPDGSTGFKCACKVQDYKISGEVAGVVQFSATLVATGAIGTV